MHIAQNFFFLIIFFKNFFFLIISVLEQRQINLYLVEKFLCYAQLYSTSIVYILYTTTFYQCCAHPTIWTSNTTLFELYLNFCAIHQYYTLVLLVKMYQTLCLNFCAIHNYILLVLSIYYTQLHSTSIVLTLLYGL